MTGGITGVCAGEEVAVEGKLETWCEGGGEEGEKRGGVSGGVRDEDGGGLG